MADTKSKGKTELKSKEKPKVSVKTKPAVKTRAKSSPSAAPGVTFKCSLCEKQKPISEMKVIRRYRPVIFVCHDCEKTIQ